MRPSKALEGVRTRFPETDVVIIRENHEDLYAGIEFEMGKPETLELIAEIERLNGAKVRDDSGISIKPISVFGTERIARYGFEYARKHGRKKVTIAHKANIMKFTDGLWLKTAMKIAEEYPEFDVEERIIDNLCNQLVSRPEEYDLVILPNLFGDIVSDLAAGMIGGLGVAPGANIGDEYAIFEAVHGSAPKYKGLNKINPTALMRSGVMMLEYLDEDDAAKRLESAIADVIREGESVTYDLKPTRDDPSAVGTSEYADAIIAKLSA